MSRILSTTLFGQPATFAVRRETAVGYVGDWLTGPLAGREAQPCKLAFKGNAKGEPGLETAPHEVTSRASAPAPSSQPPRRVPVLTEEAKAARLEALARARAVVKANRAKRLAEVGS